MSPCNDDAPGRRLLRLRVRFRLRRPGRVIVEAAPRLAAEKARGDSLVLQHRRRVPRIVVVGVPDARRHREIHVEADQVDQLERPHPEAAGVADHRVERRRVGGALGEEPQRFRVERPRAAIDDEPGRRSRAHGRLAPRERRGIRGLDDIGRGREPADDFDQRHRRRRIEEVHADDPLGALHSRGERRDRDRRSVRREDALGDGDILDARKELALRGEVLDDRFDHQLGDTDVRQRDRPSRCARARPGPRLPRAGPSPHVERAPRRWPSSRRPPHRTAHRAAERGGREALRSARCPSPSSPRR